jgi:hypothetical protein
MRSDRGPRWVFLQAFGPLISLNLVVASICVSLFIWCALRLSLVGGHLSFSTWFFLLSCIAGVAFARSTFSRTEPKAPATDVNNLRRV